MVIISVHTSNSVLRIEERDVEHVAEVMAGREHGTVGGQHHANRIAVGDLAQRIRELDHDIERERVALLWIVERDRGDNTAI